MAQEALNHQNSVLKICVDELGPGHMAGCLVGRRLSAPQPFSGMGGLLLQVERLMEQQNFPQAFQRIRTFDHREDAGHGEPCLPENAMDQASVDRAVGQTNTFLLYVTSRQSATWQGRVDWLDGAEPREFSSDLEFLNLVDEKLS